MGLVGLKHSFLCCTYAKVGTGSNWEFEREIHSCFAYWKVKPNLNHHETVASSMQPRVLLDGIEELVIAEEAPPKIILKISWIFDKILVECFSKKVRVLLI